MPSLDVARRMASVKYNNAKTMGQIYKEESDWAMEYTWLGDIQSKVCYIYDFFHDDQPQLNKGMTYENTTKTKIDAKFIVKSYQSMDKDQIEYYLQFKPSQKVEFSEDDELYYFETEYRKKYHNDNFVGLYIDIPDDVGTYRKWLICRTEPANQFPKYLILPCDYYLTWIERNGQERIKRKMWCVTRLQSSYNIGVYTNYRFTRMDNQDKLWLPLNSISDKFWYTDDSTKNMRLIISASIEHPLAWTITKVENIHPKGIQKLTIYQSPFNPHKDYIEKDSNGNITGMYADYFDVDIEPTNPDTPTTPPSANYGKIISSTQTIKIGGSYKNFTVKIYDEKSTDITDEYSAADYIWTCFINDVDITENVSFVKSDDFNTIKIKLPNNREYLDKILNVRCSVHMSDLTIDTNADFEIVI